MKRSTARLTNRATTAAFPDKRSYAIPLLGAGFLRNQKSLGKRVENDIAEQRYFLFMDQLGFVSVNTDLIPGKH